MGSRMGRAWGNCYFIQGINYITNLILTGSEEYILKILSRSEFCAHMDSKVPVTSHDRVSDDAPSHCVWCNAQQADNLIGADGGTGIEGGQVARTYPCTVKVGRWINVGVEWKSTYTLPLSHFWSFCLTSHNAVSPITAYWFPLPPSFLPRPWTLRQWAKIREILGLADKDTVRTPRYSHSAFYQSLPLKHS